MYKKLLFILIILIFSFLFIPQNNKLITTFRFSNEPIVIGKGNYGQSLVVELSFSHKGLEEWVNQLNKPYPLFMLDADWIERSPEMIELFQRKNIPTGLYGKINEDEFSLRDFQKEISLYEKYFHSKPLWYMTSNYQYPNELKQAALKENINLLSPSFIYSEFDIPNQNNGAIISIPLHESVTPNFSKISTYIKSTSFISIEENIFGFSMKSKKTP